MNGAKREHEWDFSASNPQTLHVVGAVAAVAQQQLALMIAAATHLILIVLPHAHAAGVARRLVLRLVLLQQAPLLHFLQSLWLVLESLPFIFLKRIYFEANVLMAAKHMHAIHQHDDVHALRGVSTDELHATDTQQQVVVRQRVESENAAQMPLRVDEQIDVQPHEALAVQEGAAVADEGSAGGLGVTEPPHTHCVHHGQEAIGAAQRAAVLLLLALHHALRLTRVSCSHLRRPRHPLAVLPRERLQRGGQGLCEGLQRGQQPRVVGRQLLQRWHVLRQQRGPDGGHGVLLQKRGQQLGGARNG